MASYDINDTLRTDPRFMDLCSMVPRNIAYGAICCLWDVGQTYWRKNKTLIPEQVAERLPNIAELIDVGLAVKKSDGIYCSGAEERWQFILSLHQQRAAAGRASATARLLKFGTAIPVNAPNKTTERPNDPDLDPDLDPIKLKKEERKKSGVAKATPSIPQVGNFPIHAEFEITQKIPENIQQRWLKLYDQEHLEREFTKIVTWLAVNPRKNKRTTRGWVQFIGSWLERGWTQRLNGFSSNRVPPGGIGSYRRPVDSSAEDEITNMQLPIGGSND